MAFPTSPINGQIYRNTFGSAYQYYAADNKWVKAGINVGVTGPQGITGMGIQGATGIRGTTGVDTGITGAINLVFDGGGNVVTTGYKVDMTIPFNLAPRSYRFVGTPTGSIYVDLYRDTYTNYPSGQTGTVHGITGPYINSGVKNTDSVLSGWTGSWNAYDILRVNVKSVSTITNATLTINYSR